MNNLLKSSDTKNKHKQDSSDIASFHKKYAGILTYFINNKKEYIIKMHKVSNQEIKKTTYYSSSESLSYVPITNKHCGDEKLQALLEHGANPYMTNELGMTYQHIAAIYCPSIFYTYNDLFEKTTL